MQNIVFYVAGSETLGTVRDYANAKTLTAPVLVRGVETCLKMRLFENAEGLTPYPTSAFSNIVAWQFIMDRDFDPATGYILEADDANISYATVTDTINGETITYTQFSIPIPNMNTEALVRWLSTDESKSGLNAELIGFDGTGEQVFVLQVKGFVVRGRISSMGEPSEIIPEYLTAPQVRALVASGVVFQYSADAVNWHDAQTSGDIYYRQRSASSATSAWSTPVLIAKGEKGDSGKIVTGAGEINVQISGSNAKLVSTITGGTTSVPISDNSFTVPEDFIGTVGRCEFDLINSNGKNITTDPAVSRQWLSNGYKVKIATGFTAYQYALKPCGIRGEKGEAGHDGFEDYTAFEVIANSEAIPAGSTAYKGIDLSVIVGEQTLPTAVEIPIGMEHEFKAWVISGAEVRVEWGDGKSEHIPAIDSIATCNHVYETAGKYLVKVYGDFVRIITTSTKNLIHRVLDEGLPLARHHNSLQAFAQNALRLVAVDIPGWGKCAQIESLLNTFSECKNLRSVSGLSRIPHLVSCNSAFKDCWNMVSCDFRLPPVMLNQPGGSDAYRAVFYSSANVNWALTRDVSAFFPDGGFAADYNDLSQLFYNYRADIRYPNLTLSDANAAKLAKTLWKASEKRFGYRSATDEAGGQSGIFRCMPDAVRAKIPTQWGGTMVDPSIDVNTGVTPLSVQAGNGITIDGGIVSVKYTDGLTVTTDGQLTVNFTDIGVFLESELKTNLSAYVNVCNGIRISENALELDTGAKLYGGTASLADDHEIVKRIGYREHLCNISPLCYNSPSSGGKVGILIDENVLKVTQEGWLTISLGTGLKRPENNTGILLDVDADVFGGTASLADDHAALAGKQDKLTLGDCLYWNQNALYLRVLAGSGTSVAQTLWGDFEFCCEVMQTIRDEVLPVENYHLYVAGENVTIVGNTISATGRTFSLGDYLYWNQNTLYLRVLAGSGANIAETLWKDFEFCCSTMQTIRDDVLTPESGHKLYSGENGVSITGTTISLSGERLATYNESYINLQGGTANQHPNATLVVGANTVSEAATNSVICGGSNQCSNSYSTMFGYQLISSAVQFQTVVGRSNKQDADAYFIVGNGTSSTVRKNAFTVKKNGNGVFAGDVLSNGGTVSMANLLSRIEALEAAVAKLK